jgi:hypothetical protein
MISVSVPTIIALEYQKTKICIEIITDKDKEKCAPWLVQEFA